MAEKFDHEQLSIRPDRDQVEAYKSKRPKSGNNPTEQTQNKEKPSGSGSGLSILLLTVLSVAGGVGGWWFYQKDMDIQKELQLADSRILALEKQLSLVDAEFGASSGDIRVELQKLSSTSKELWVQMDKLWASAWRRNQADIEKLNSFVKIHSDQLSRKTKNDESVKSSIAEISQKSSETEINMEMLTEQVETALVVKNELIALKDEIASLQSKSIGSDKNQIVIGSKITKLESNQQLLIDQIQRLQDRLKNVEKDNI